MTNSFLSAIQKTDFIPKSSVVDTINILRRWRKSTLFFMRMFTQGVYQMHNVSLNGEILNKVSMSDFDKLVSVPKATEDSQVKFKEEKSLDAILKEFGY